MNNTAVHVHLPRSAFEDPLFSDPVVAQHGRSFVMSNVVRSSPTHRFVNLDTRFSDSSSSSSSPVSTFTLPERVSNVRSLSICSIEVPLLYLNVSPELDNTVISLTENGHGEVQFTIPSGNYSASTLVSALNSLIVSSNYTFVFSATTATATNPFPKLQIAASSRISIGISSASSTSTVLCFSSNLAWMLGFRHSSKLAFSGPSTLTSDAIINLSVPKYLYLVLDEFAARTSSSNSFYAPQYSRNCLDSNIVARFTVEGGGGGAGTYFAANKHNGHLISDTREYGKRGIDIQKLQVQVVNEFGIPVQFLGCDYSLCLRLETE